MVRETLDFSGVILIELDEDLSQVDKCELSDLGRLISEALEDDVKQLEIFDFICGPDLVDIELRDALKHLFSNEVLRVVSPLADHLH